MRCIRQGLPRAGAKTDSEVGEALNVCVSAGPLEAVTSLVLLGSCIQRLTTVEQEVPYTCGEEMMELVRSVGGALEDTMELRDSVPLPQQKGGAINVIVETAQEVLKLSRDSLEAASLQAVQIPEAEDPLLVLPRRFPLQAVLLATRVRFTKLVDDALTAGTPLPELREVVATREASVEEHLRQDLPARERIAFGELQKLLKEQSTVVDMLAAAGSPSEAASLWDGELRFCVSVEKEAFSCSCTGKTVPLGFEYNPKRVLPASESVRRFRHVFVNTCVAAASRRERRPAFMISGPDSATKTELVEDVCSLLGGAPVVVQGSKAKDTDTFWSRAMVATRASSGGSPLPVLIVEDAHLAERSALEAADAESREQKVVVCYTVDPELMKFKLEDCVGDAVVRFDLAST